MVSARAEGSIAIGLFLVGWSALAAHQRTTDHGEPGPFPKVGDSLVFVATAIGGGGQRADAEESAEIVLPDVLPGDEEPSRLEVVEGEPKAVPELIAGESWKLLVLLAVFGVLFSTTLTLAWPVFRSIETSSSKTQLILATPIVAAILCWSTGNFRAGNWIMGVGALVGMLQRGWVLGDFRQLLSKKDRQNARYWGTARRYIRSRSERVRKQHLVSDVFYGTAIAITLLLLANGRAVWSLIWQGWETLWSGGEDGVIAGVIAGVSQNAGMWSLAATPLLVALGTRLIRSRAGRARISLVVGATMGVGTFGLIVLQTHIIQQLVIHPWDYRIAGGLSGVALSGALVYVFFKNRDHWWQILRKLRIAGAVLAVAVAACVLGCAALPRESFKAWDPSVSIERQELVGAIRASAVAGGYLLVLALIWVVRAFSPRTWSLHYLFRDRIVDTFLTRSNGERFEDLRLGQLRATGSEKLTYWGPLPLINMAMNLTDDSEGQYADRNAAPFVAAPWGEGSRAFSVNGFQQAGNHGMRLGKALTISAAAVSPQMGRYSSFSLWVLANLFNLRLGAFVPRPGVRLGRFHRWLNAHALELFWGRRKFHPEQDTFYVTDGGHYDNSGVLALLERRCEFIVAIDGEADPDGDCAGLADALRYARQDHGIEVDIDLADVAPVDGRWARSPCAIGRITYPALKTPDTAVEERTGWLVYVKLGISPLASDTRQYAIDNPTFPFEPTANQFFRQAQFEAYRQLGFQSMERTVGPAGGSSLDASDHALDRLLTLLSGAWRAHSLENPRLEDEDGSTGDLVEQARLAFHQGRAWDRGRSHWSSAILALLANEESLSQSLSHSDEPFRRFAESLTARPAGDS
ncbi:MAG: hypothetical protein AAGE52_38290 [Myxococcota bacterium]